VKSFFLITAFFSIAIASDQPRELKVTQVDCADTCKVTVSWQKNIEPDMLYYSVYHGTASRSYADTVRIDHPDTSVVIGGLAMNTLYFFTVTATDTADNESDYSQEVQFFFRDTTAISDEIADDFGVYDPFVWRIGSNPANTTAVENGMMVLRSTAEEAGWVHTLDKYSLLNKTVNVYFAKTGGSCDAERLVSRWDCI
jgi:hypothetical protein